MSGLGIYSFEPICDENSKVLILGTMPSPASLKAGMYYSHPQNAFWRILTDLTGDETGTANQSRREFLLRHGIALWDTLKMCEREGALDSSIKSEEPNDVADLIKRCPRVKAVFLNGGAALRYYKKYHAKNIAMPFFALPSTSPANARGGYKAKLQGWAGLKEFLED